MSTLLDIPLPISENLLILSTRLPAYSLCEETFFEPATDNAGPFANYDDFRQRGLKLVSRQVRCYLVFNGEMQLVIPETYAIKLDEIRRIALSSLQEQSTNAAPLESSRRVLPEELVGYLEKLPMRELFTRVYLLDETNPEDIWVKQTFSPTFVSAMATLPNGNLFLFRPERNECLFTDLLHEWSHRLQQVQPEENRAFEDAIELGWRKFVPKPYALRSYGEHWAVFGEGLLHPDSTQFLWLVSKAPIRSVVWVMALDKALARCQEGARSPHYEKLLARIRYVKDNVLSLAQQELFAILARKDVETQIKERAQSLCKFLNINSQNISQDGLGNSSPNSTP